MVHHVAVLMVERSLNDPISSFVGNTANHIS